MVRSRVLVRMLIILLTAIPASVSLAELDEEGVLFYGEETVSTPSRRAQPIEESPAPVTVITREDIRQSGALTLSEAIALAPGVDSIRRSEANQEISIRGFNSYSSNKVLVMLDSRPLFNLADASVNWNLVPVSIDEVERIEIVRGPGSVLYGENAFFGTINIITGVGEDRSSRISGGLGTGESNSAGAAVARPTFTAHAEHLELDRFSKRHSDVPNKLLDELGSQPTTVSVRVNRAFARWEPEYGLGSLALTGGFAQVDAEHISLRTTDRMAFVAVDRGLWDQGVDYELGLRVMAQEQEVSEDPFTFSGPYQNFVRTDLELRGVYAPAVSDIMVFGIGFSHRSVEDDLFLESVDWEVQQMSLSAYLENQLSLAQKRLFLTTGLRADTYQETRGMVSPRAGLVFILSPEHSIKLGWGQAYRSPTVYELYGESRLDPPWVFSGNAGLRPESISSWNLDYFFQDPEGVTLSASLFYHDMRDLIIFKLESQSITERVYRLENEDRASSYGGELEARASITKKLNAWANYSYNEATYLSEDHKVKAPFSPRHKANAGLCYADSKWSLSVFARYVGEQVGVNFDAPFQSRLTLKDYGLISARLEVELVRDLTVSVTGSDLFGQGHFEAPNYAPVTPYYFVKISWDPGW